MLGIFLCVANGASAIVNVWIAVNPWLALFNAFVAGWLFYQFVLEGD